jgi:hypothetical protein
MNTPDTHCREARLMIGADPRGALPPALAAHVEGCEACRRFRADTLALETRLQAALELPLQQPVPRQLPVRRFALAASVALALFFGGAFWMLRPSSALAGEVVEHVEHEPSSWQAEVVLPESYVAGVLAEAGVKIDMKYPVVYATRCPFRGGFVPHLVVQTDSGPVTVMVLARERVRERTEFAEGGYRGVIVPAGDGAIAVITRWEIDPAEVAAEVVPGEEGGEK